MAASIEEKQTVSKTLKVSPIATIMTAMTATLTSS
jgi:hypothetical protein